MQGASTPSDPSRLAPGRTIGPFVVEGELGAGGMGVVYRAVGPGGVPAAVKVLRVGLASAEARQRFEREAAIRIDHPNLIQVLDAGVDEPSGCPYIALELLTGESLEQRLTRGPLPAREVVELGLAACRGLEAAHAAGVVHRDLKPSNLFLCAGGGVKVLDFGIALVSTRETRLTSAGGIIGTPAYMSPEQVRGDATVDLRTDVWSLGAVLYEALAGRPPFMRETALAVMLAIHMDEPEPLWSLARGAPPALGAAIERALGKRPELRWASMADLGAALAAIEHGAEAARAPTDRPPPSEISFDETISAESIAPALLPSLIPAGEHRIVAVLLAEGVRDLAAIGAAIREHGGSLLPLIGQRAIGLFGAETWEGDEVACAASAALAARRAAVRMSVASGRATSSGGGISGAVLRAAEAGCAAGLSGVAVDAATARSLEAQFQVVPAGPSLWEIIVRKATESVPFGPISVAPPLLGREAELAQMRAALRSVLEEARASVVLVGGPPGIGKSRLRVAMEGEIEGASEPIFALGARAEPLQREAALSLWGAALKSRLYARTSAPNATILDLDLSAAERRGALSELVGEAIDNPVSAAACAEFLGELVGVSMPESKALLAARADPQLMADRLRLSLLDFFEGLAEKGPVALLLEDLQWADQASMAFLEDLLDRLSEAPLLVFATARSELFERRPGLFAGRNLVKIDPRGLISSDVAALARWIAGRPLPEPLARALAERTAGHPLFVEQIVRELKDHGQLEGEVGELPMPLTVEAAVQSRLDHLPPAEKDACKRASIFGRPFSTEELEAMGVGGAAALLGSLGKRDLVTGRVKAGGGRGRQFQFRSTLVVDVAYGMLADEVRRDLHRRAALYLGGQAQADDEEVGSHHERGGEPLAAAARYAAAALGAAPRGDTPTVLRCSEKALALGAPLAQRFALHMARAESLKFLGKRDAQGQELGHARGRPRPTWRWRASSPSGRPGGSGSARSRGARRRGGRDGGGARGRSRGAHRRPRALRHRAHLHGRPPARPRGVRRGPGALRGGDAAHAGVPGRRARAARGCDRRSRRAPRRLRGCGAALPRSGRSTPRGRRRGQPRRCVQPGRGLRRERGRRAFRKAIEDGRHQQPPDGRVRARQPGLRALSPGQAGGARRCACALAAAASNREIRLMLGARVPGARAARQRAAARHRAGRRVRRRGRGKWADRDQDRGPHRGRRGP
ncbi:MAG: protein kinase [Byssovorax sp.]